MADAQIRAVITAEDKASGVIQNFSSSLQSLATVAGGVFALDKVLGFGEEVINAFNQADKATTELNAVLQSTGDISGVTAKQAEDLATSLSQVTTFSKTTTLAAEDVLLRFTNIGQSIFPQTLKATQDLATGLGTDLSSAAAIVGRALDAPANASRSLRSAQIVLNSSQQEYIKTLTEAGKGEQAQAYILDILTTKFGGLSTAVGQTFGGQVKILQNNLELIKEQMGSVISNAIGPFVDMISNYVSHNQEFISALGIAAIAAMGFAAAMIAVAGAIALALAISTPFLVVLLALSAIVGVTVFKAVENFQGKMAQTTKDFATGSKSIANNGAQNFGTAGKAASDLAQKLADIDEQMNKTTRDFREQVAQIAQDHQQKVTDLKQQLGDETNSFDKAQTDQTRSHEQKTRDLESQIRALQITNSQADQQRINDLRVTLAQEDEAYQKDTANAQQAHATKLSDLQTKLDAETAFLVKHGDDIAAVQNVQLLDELDKLKRSHMEQMAEFNKQKDRAIKSAADTTSGMANQFNGLPGQINGNLLGGVGSQLGHDMAQALKDSFVAAVRNLPQDLHNWANDIAGWLNKVSHGGLVGSAFNSVPIPNFRAEGGPVSGGSPYIVGEQGPELFVPSSSGSIVPNNKMGTININLNAQAFMGSQVEARKFAQTIANHLQDIAGMKGATV